VNAGSGYFAKLLPGMLLLAVAMGCLFVPLTVTAVSKVANTDAGLASALLNVGQQVGGALGLSVMATVFGTSGRNYAKGHIGNLFQQLHQATTADPGLGTKIGRRVQAAGSNGLQNSDINSFVSGLPKSQQGTAHSFFYGAYKDFAHALLAHASGEGFLTGAGFGGVAIIAAIVLKLSAPRRAGTPRRADNSARPVKLSALPHAGTPRRADNSGHPPEVSTRSR
jgi:hypothetical protein